jgi:hypothetical protein
LYVKAELPPTLKLTLEIDSDPPLYDPRYCTLPCDDSVVERNTLIVPVVGTPLAVLLVVSVA